MEDNIINLYIVYVIIHALDTNTIGRENIVSW